jgi:hypothetical protein
MLSFYLAFVYADRPYYIVFLERILCMSKYLFEVQQKNRLEQKGLLRRFSITCYGHQESIEEMRAHKAEKYKELKQKGNMEEFDEWFLTYKPGNKLMYTNSDGVKPLKKKKNNKKKTKKAKSKAKPFAIYGGKTARRRY